ncbi:hypothetical protein BTVI_97185 [Pitangus sulphuratus]|nr:hypothetical protein BTVI_97185 [Pitangus sulphuratus]
MNKRKMQKKICGEILKSNFVLEGRNKAFLFFRLKNPNCLSFSSQERYSIPPIILVTLSGLARTSWCPSCAGDRRAGCSTPGGVSPEQSRGAESPPLICSWTALDAAKDTGGFLDCKCTLPGPVQPLIH